jgi:hypothetical protein
MSPAFLEAKNLLTCQFKLQSNSIWRSEGRASLDLTIPQTLLADVGK